MAAAPILVISVSRPGLAVGVERLAQLEHVGGRRVRPDLASDRVADAAQELDVRTVEGARALADPEHVGRAVVPAAGERVLPRERLLVAEEERFVAGEDIDGLEVGVRLGVDAAGLHEPHRPIDLGRHALVATALGAGGDELLGPHVDPAEVGEAALGECPQQVERRRRLVVRLHQPFGVGHPCLGVGGRVVDDVTAERQELLVAHLLGGVGTGLGELAGHAADLHDRHSHRVGEDDRHLEDDAQLLADAGGREVLEALGAVTRLQQERLAGGDLTERVLQRPRLAGEHERRERGDLLQRQVEARRVGPLGLLVGVARLPGPGTPRRRHADRL